MSQSSRFFRWVYGGLYFFLCIILLALLLITPGDAIERSLHNDQQYHVWLLIIVLVVTILVVCFIYFFRLYVNRTILASIPKTWIPIEVGDVKKHVHAMISDGLEKSALIAYEARPRAGGGGESRRAAVEKLGIDRDLQRRIWGGIEHKGWASPESPDLPNLQYSTVLAELPNLIEAKALTLAPPDPTIQGAEAASMLDSEAVALLQRPPNFSLRSYIDQLISLGILDSGDPAGSFLQKYEHARFSTEPLSYASFRQLMDLFSELLRSMTNIDFSLLFDMDSVSASSIRGFESQVDNDDVHTRSIHSRTPSGTASMQDYSVLRQGSLRPPFWGQDQTVPSSPRSGGAPTSASLRSLSLKSARSTGSDMFAQARRPFQMPGPSSSSARSAGSDYASSVIRLATRDDGNDDEHPPYLLNMGETAIGFGRALR